MYLGKTRTLVGPASTFNGRAGVDCTAGTQSFTRGLPPPGPRPLRKCGQNQGHNSMTRPFLRTTEMGQKHVEFVTAGHVERIRRKDKAS